VSNDAVDKVTLMPALDHADFSAVMTCAVASFPLSYCSSKFILVPAGIPAPHWLGPVPGDAQVLVPLGTTVQPWLFRRDAALLGLYAYGFSLTSEDTKELAGSVGTGPYVPMAYPL
jgi:hypothetical protein